MAFRHGRWAEVEVAGDPLSAFCDSADLSIDVDTADTTTFLSTWKSAVVGTAGGKFAIKGVYDPTATTGPQALLQPLIGADPVEITFYPGGNVAGQVLNTFDAILTSYTESSPVGDKVSFSAAFLVTGAVTPTIVSA